MYDEVGDSQTKNATGVCIREQGTQTDEMCRKAGYCPTSRGLPTVVHPGALHFSAVSKIYETYDMNTPAQENRVLSDSRGLKVHFQCNVLQ